MPRYRVTIQGKDYDAMADLVRTYRIAISGHTVKSLARGAYSVHALASGQQIRTLERAGYKIKRHEDVDAAGRARRAEIRKPSARVGPEALRVDSTSGYLSVADVEAALAAAAGTPNDAVVQLFPLPHPTWEGRTCHAVR